MWLTGRKAPFQRFFQRLLPPLPVKRAGKADLLPPSFYEGARIMLNSRSQSQLACAFGALAFAGLSFGAALFPLIVA
jgi:hypothetical protein